MNKFYFAALLLSVPALLHAQTFAPPVTYAMEANTFPSVLKMADMNGDGYPDIVTSNAGPNQPAVLLNQRNGTLGPARYYFSNAHAVLEDVAVGDITKDGSPDVVVLDFGGTVSLLYNQGNGSLSSSIQYTVEDQAVGLTLGDVDNDGYLDAVTSSLGRGGVVSVLLNTKNNRFGSSVPYSTSASGSPYDVTLGDVNKDGYLDIVTAVREGAAGILLNKKDGTFSPLVAYTTGSSTHPENVTLNDINKDGHLDIITTDRTRDAVQVLLNNTDGTFGLPSSYPIGNMSRPEGFAVADVDGDGYPDIATANMGTNTVGVLRNKKDGTFAPVVLYPTGSNSQPTDLALSDMNNDGKLDMVVSNYNSTVSLFFNTSILATQSGASPQSQAVIYPNPTTGQVPILTAVNLPVEARNLQATLTNAVGQPVRQLTLPATQGVVRAELPTAGLAPGLYFLQLTACDAQGVSVKELSSQRLSLN